jgi:hypothetical protein
MLKDWLTVGDDLHASRNPAATQFAISATANFTLTLNISLQYEDSIHQFNQFSVKLPNSLESERSPGKVARS